MGANWWRSEWKLTPSIFARSIARTMESAPAESPPQRLNVTKRTRKPRRPEVSRILERVETPERLTFVERDLLDRNGFGDQLRPSRKREAKMSAKAKALLLAFHDYCRQGVAQDEPEGYDLARLYDMQAAHCLAPDRSRDRFVFHAVDDRQADARQRAADFRHEIGPRFLAGEIDREAQVRQWCHRLPSR